MISAENCYRIFSECISDYHKTDNIEQPIHNPYEVSGISYLFYLKSWIDTVQWHYEDLIRDPDIVPEYGMTLKRLIDHSNQFRTNVVEQIDDWLMDQFKNVKPAPGARLNTESPAWAIDRLSILALKIYHMEEQANRTDADAAHRHKSNEKLTILIEQLTDLMISLDQLLEDIGKGIRIMKVYRQMKMYNDPATNPILYRNK